jgi:hypothetical protein
MVLSQGFTIQPSAVARGVMRVTESTSSLQMVFGNRKSKEQAAASATTVPSKYWEGDWVCKDCGYIYNRVSGIKSYDQ